MEATDKPREPWMLVLVCGSRRWPDRKAVERRIDELPDDSEVISGMARGVDSWAAEAAQRRGLTVRPFYADWRGDGKRAGIIRNVAMLDEGPDLVIAFRADGSPGTSHTVREAERRGIVVELHESLGAGR